MRRTSFLLQIFLGIKLYLVEYQSLLGPEAVLNNENPRTNPKGFNGLINGTGYLSHI